MRALRRLTMQFSPRRLSRTSLARGAFTRSRPELKSDRGDAERGRRPHARFMSCGFLPRSHRALRKEDYLHGDYNTVNDYRSTGRGARASATAAEEGRFSRDQIDGGRRAPGKGGSAGRCNATIIRGDCKSGFEVTVYGNADETATHACRGNTPIIIASSVAIHQAGVRVANGRDVRASERAASIRLRKRARERARVKIRPGQRRRWRERSLTRSTTEAAKRLESFRARR